MKSDTFPLHNLLIVQFKQKCGVRKFASAVTLIILSRDLSGLGHIRWKRKKHFLYCYSNVIIRLLSWNLAPPTFPWIFGGKAMTRLWSPASTKSSDPPLYCIYFKERSNQHHVYSQKLATSIMWKLQHVISAEFVKEKHNITRDEFSITIIPSLGLQVKNLSARKLTKASMKTTYSSHHLQYPFLNK